MINLLTVKVGNKYNSQHVNRLVKSFKTAHEFKAYCITDDPTGLDANIQAIQPSLKVPGWWNKVQLFSPDMPQGRQIYFDLDMVLLGSFDQLLSGHQTHAAKDPYRWQGCELNSSFIIWDSWLFRDIYLDFEQDPYFKIKHCPGGDQQYIGRYIWRPKWTKHIASYKKDIQPTNKIPPGALAINFHGQPKPDEIMNDPQHPFHEQLKQIW